jgi:acyl carrier protein
MIGNTLLSKDAALSGVVEMLRDMVADWDLDHSEAIGPNTRLIEDLAFESIDIVQLVVAIEQKFQRKGLPFEKLFMRDGDYVEEISVAEVVDFLYTNLK